MRVQASGRHETRSWLGAVFFVVLFAGLAPEAAAFTKEGHTVIEAMAYKRLLGRSEATTSASGEAISGRELLSALIRARVLSPPDCFEDEACKGQKGDPLKHLPPLRSGEPDDFIARHLGSNGQCFHFMARTADITNSDMLRQRAGAWFLDGSDVEAKINAEEKEAIPRGLVGPAYERCIQLMNTILNEIRQTPQKANDNIRGTYAMLHIIGDSFSEAHTSRNYDQGASIRYLKAWTVRSAFRYTFACAGLLPMSIFSSKPLAELCSFYWDHHSSVSHHHFFNEPRDESYLKEGGGGCSALDHPYNMRFECLSRPAQLAVRAVEDFLVVLYNCLEEDYDDWSLSTKWSGYLKTHFKPDEAFFAMKGHYDPDRLTSAGHVEMDAVLPWRTGTRLGLRLREQSTSIAIEFPSPSEYLFINPDVFAQLKIAGLDNDELVGISYGVNLSLPVFDFLAVGVGLAQDLTFTNDDADVEFELVPYFMIQSSRLWLRASVFRGVLPLSEGESTGEFFDLGQSEFPLITLEIGGLLDFNFIDSTRHIFTSRDVEGGSLTEFDMGTLHVEPRNHVTLVIPVGPFTGASWSLEDDRVTRSVKIAHFNALWNPYSGGEKTWWGLGVHLNAEYRRIASFSPFAFLAAPEIRLYPSRGADFGLSLDLKPFFVDLSDFKSFRPEKTKFGYQLGVSIQLFRDVELTFELPRFEYPHEKDTFRALGGEHFGFRFGIILDL